jgi:autotransporter-associated beta strand protein
VVNGGTITFTPASQSVSALSGTGGTVAFTSGAHTLTIAQASSTSYDGAITGSSVAVTKSGAGVLTLTGTNTYGGATTISAGTLKIDGSINNSAVSVASGGTLAGSGSAGATTLNSGGFISPANGSIGNLSLASLTFNGGGTLNLGLGSGTSSDSLTIAGAFTKGSVGQYTIDFGNTGTAGNTYTLATFGSSTFSSGADFTFANLASGVTGTFNLGTNDLTFTTTAAIPEPSTYAAILGIGALGFVIYRRRKASPAVAVTTEV